MGSQDKDRGTDPDPVSECYLIQLYNSAADVMYTVSKAESFRSLRNLRFRQGRSDQQSTERLPVQSLSFHFIKFVASMLLSKSVQRSDEEKGAQSPESDEEDVIECTLKFCWAEFK